MAYMQNEIRLAAIRWILPVAACFLTSTTMAQKIKITIGTQELTATLEDNKTTRDFIALLPLDLSLEDYAGTEKVSNLPKRLSTQGAPSGSDAIAGDITYYAPWGNLAIFYKDFRYAEGLITLGHINESLEPLTASASFQVKIDLVE